MPDDPSKKPDDSGLATFGRYFAVGIMLPIASMVGYAAGYEVDKHFGTTWFKIVLMLLGTIGGFIQLIREVKRG